jgi:excinuclease UvrABC helicase subunit UvrB
VEQLDPSSLTPYDKKKILKKLEREMKKQAEQMNFETAIMIRDKIKEIKAA